MTIIRVKRGLRVPGAGGGASGRAVEGLVLLDDFTSRRPKPQDTGYLWDIYNAVEYDAGPNQGMTQGSGADKMFKVDVGPNSNFYVQFQPSPYLTDLGTARGNLQSGTFDSRTNRMCTMLRATRSWTWDGSGDSFNIGTYYKTNLNDGQPSYQGEHYYHGIGRNSTANKWALIVMTNAPDHQVGDPTGTPPYAIKSDYFTYETRFYITDWGPGDQTNLDYDMDMGPWYMYYDPHSIEDIRTVVFHHTGTQYSLQWHGAWRQEVTYNVRVRYDGNPFTDFSQGASVGSATSRGDDYMTCSLNWTAAESTNGCYAAIQPVGASSTSFRQEYLTYQLSPDNPGLVAA